MSRATLAQLKSLGLDSYAISQMDDSDLQLALDAAADRIDGILAPQFPPPILTPYPLDLIECECVLASWTALNVRGYRPASKGDDSIQRRYRAWDNDSDTDPGWLQKVAKGEVVPKIVASGAEGTESAASGPMVITSTSRGYSERGVSPWSPPVPNTTPFSDD
jgi:phage gp36-like protein